MHTHTDRPAAHQTCQTGCGRSEVEPFKQLQQAQPTLIELVAESEPGVVVELGRLTGAGGSFSIDAPPPDSSLYRGGGPEPSGASQVSEEDLFGPGAHVDPC